MEFWGAQVKAGQPLKVVPEEGRLVHISQAALGEVKSGKGPKRCYLRLNIAGQSYVIGTLSAEERPQLMFDLVLEKEFELSHDWKEGIIHMAGYTADEEQSELGDDYIDELENDSLSDEEMQVDTPTVVETEKPKTKETEKPKKKEAKLVNKKRPADEEDEDDSDEDEEDDEETVKVSSDKMVAGDEDDSDDDEDDSDDDEDDSDDDEDDSDEEVPQLVVQKKPSISAPAAKKAKTAANDKSGKAPASSNGKVKDSKSGPSKPSNVQQSKTKKHGRK